MRMAISILSALVLITGGGCPLVTTDHADPGGVDAGGAAYPEVPNCQDCPPRAPGPTLGDGWCLDLAFIEQFHPGADTCYRGYGENAGKQCCYDSDGWLIDDDELPAAGTPDFVAPATAEAIDGSCDWLRDPGLILVHWFFDVFLWQQGIVLGQCPAADDP